MCLCPSVPAMQLSRARESNHSARTDTGTDRQSRRLRELWTLQWFPRFVCLVLLAVLGVLPSLATAQQTTVAGVVRDATSSTPLVGAIVTLGRGAEERTARSDANGAFSFSKVA